METVIKRATAENLNDILRLLGVQLVEHRIEVSADRLRSAVESVLVDPNLGFILVGVNGQKCIAVAYVSFIWALEHGGRSGWLEELYVEPGFRSGGIGTALIEQTMKECSACGCAAVDLEIEADHERVRSLYSRLGFESLSRSRVVKKLV